MNSIQQTSNIHIIDYRHIASNALLVVLDHELYTTNADGTITVDIENKDVKELLEFHVNSAIQAEYQFGKYNIIIDTCNPRDNWRHQFSDIINLPKYRIIEDQIIVDLKLLQYNLDLIWKNLSTKLKKFIWINCEDIDTIDIVSAIKIITNSPLKSPFNTYIMITDENSNYVHYEDIDSRILTEIEIILRKNRIV